MTMMTMMTLDEAIKHCEEVAEENEEIYKAHCRIYSKEVVEKYPSPPCKKCAKEHRQLAEWLKELKWLREQEPILGKIRAEIMDWQTDIHDNEHDAESHDFVFERIYEIIDEYKEREK